MARNAVTIVLLTRNELVRADFRRSTRGGLSGFWRQPRPDGQDLASIVGGALGLDARFGRRVWLLCTDLWTQTLTLPAVKMAGLSAAEQASALNFEAESLSGQSAMESVVGFTRHAAAGLDAVYWLVQASSWDLALLDGAVRKAGSRLAGVAHPAGLPQPLVATGPDHSWQRAELWPDALVCLARGGNAPPHPEVFNFDPQSGRWQAEVDQWRAGRPPADHFELLVSADVNASTGDTPAVSLAQDASLKRWLGAWAEQLGKARPAFPRVAPAPRPMSATGRRNLGLVLTAVAAGFCAAHHFLWMKPEVARLGDALRAAQEPGKRKAEQEKQIKDVEARQQALEQQVKKLERDTLALGVQRRRFARFLEVLVTEKSDDLIVRRIDNAAGEPRISGVCLKAGAADQLAGSLEQALRELHWKVLPATKQALGLRIDGGPWEFTLQVKEVLPAPAAPAGPVGGVKKPVPGPPSIKR
jgi:cell division protein FtsB